MIRFEEIDERLEALGLNRSWLAENTPYSADYIRTVLAPKSSRRTDRVQQVLSDAIEREEAAQAAAKSHPSFERQQLVLRPTDEEYSEWCRAADGAPLQDWAVGALNAVAMRLLSMAGPATGEETPRVSIIDRILSKRFYQQKTALTESLNESPKVFVGADGEPIPPEPVPRNEKRSLDFPLREEMITGTVIFGEKPIKKKP